MNAHLRNVHPARMAWLGLLGAAALLSTAALASLVSRPAAPRELLDLVNEVRAPQEQAAPGAVPDARSRRTGGGERGSSQAGEVVF